MKRSLLLILLVGTLGSFLACGVFGGSAPDGPARMVPDGALELVLVDVEEVALSRTDLPADLEGAVTAMENFGDVRQLAVLNLPSGRALITGGDFDFDVIRDNLRKGAYTVADYRGYGFLESEDGATATALLEDDGRVVAGDFGAVIDILRDTSRDSGLLWNDDEGELNRAMELVGDGLVVTAGMNCQLENNVGCRAVAWAFSRGEERRTVIEGSAALLFRDATAAAGAAAAIERSVATNELMHLTEILTSDDTVTLKVDIDRDSFPLLELPISLGR